MHGCGRCVTKKLSDDENGNRYQRPLGPVVPRNRLLQTLQEILAMRRRTEVLLSARQFMGNCWPIRRPPVPVEDFERESLASEAARVHLARPIAARTPSLQIMLFDFFRYQAHARLHLQNPGRPNLQDLETIPGIL